MKNDLTTGTVWKRLLAFALPIFGANLLHSLYGTVDLMIVGLFTDEAEISAVSTGSMTLQTIGGIVIGLTMGCTVLLGRNIGKRDYASGARTVASSLVLFVLVGFILTALMTILAAPIAGVMNAPAEAFRGTTAYIRICGFGVIFVVLFNALSGIFRGVGDSRTPLVLMGIACVCNIIGDLILVGVVKMGADGAAIATVGAQAVSVISAFFIVRKKGFGFDYDKKDLKPAKRETGMILRYGIPIAAQEALTGVSFMIILAILNTFGVTASAGVGIAEKICGLMFIVPGAMMAATSAFTAQNVGAGRRDRARAGMKAGILFSVAVGFGMFMMGFFAGNEMAHLFSKDDAVCAAAADYLRTYSIDCVLVGISFNMMGYLNGNGRTGFVALQGILSTFLVRIPVSFFMSKIPGVSLFEVALATPLATLFAIIMIVIYLRSFERKIAKTT